MIIFPRACHLFLMSRLVENSTEPSPKHHISLLPSALIHSQQWKQPRPADVWLFSDQFSSVEFREQQARGMQRVNTGGVSTPPHRPHMTGGAARRAATCAS